MRASLSQLRTLVCSRSAHGTPATATTFWLIALSSLLCSAPLAAQAPSVEGFGLDAQLTGGAGVGLDGKLANYFLARARLGALYAQAPWIGNLGLTVDVGALSGLGFGAELELNHSTGPYVSAGAARVDAGRWLAHASVGYTIFGLEWQHAFGGAAPHEALLLEVRLPLGQWWLQKRQRKAAEERQAGELRVGHVTPRGPTAQTGARTSPSPQARAPAADSADTASTGDTGADPARPEDHVAPGDEDEGAAASAGDPQAREQQLATLLAEAQHARDSGDHVGQGLALARAYALSPEPVVALRLSEAELAMGHPRAALRWLGRVGDLETLPEAERAPARLLQQQLMAAISHVRVQLSGDIRARDLVQIDDEEEPSAGFGYDIALDPGSHTLRLVRDGRVLLERAFTTEAGQLLRLDIEVPSDPMR